MDYKIPLVYATPNRHKIYALLYSIRVAILNTLLEDGAINSYFLKISNTLELKFKRGVVMGQAARYMSA